MPDTDIIIPRTLLDRIAQKKTVLDSARPLPPDILERLRQEFRLHHTYNSNAIEGNTLTLSETRIVMEERITIGGKALREHLEVTGTANGFDLVCENAAPGRKIDEKTVKILHRVVTSGILEEPGTYRKHNVRITGAKKRPPDHTLVPKAMKIFVKEANRRDDSPLEAAARLHHLFTAIHPFPDGNGRMARLLTNFHLMSSGYPPIVLRKEDRLRYYSCLASADKGDHTPLAVFIARAVDEALSIYLSAFGKERELVPLKELARGSPYSQEYLSLRARQGELDAVKVRGVWHSSKLALEEYMDNIGK